MDALGNGISRGSLGASLDSITNQKELMQHSLKSTTSKRDRLKHPRRCLNIAKEIRLRGDETSLIHSFSARLQKLKHNCEPPLNNQFLAMIVQEVLVQAGHPHKASRADLEVLAFSKLVGRISSGLSFYKIKLDLPAHQLCL